MQLWPDIFRFGTFFSVSLSDSRSIMASGFSLDPCNSFSIFFFIYLAFLLCFFLFQYFTSCELLLLLIVVVVVVVVVVVADLSLLVVLVVFSCFCCLFPFKVNRLFVDTNRKSRAYTYFFGFSDFFYEKMYGKKIFIRPCWLNF